VRGAGPGRTRPERVEHRGGKGLVLVHRCIVCGFVRPNRIAGYPVQGDEIDAIIALMPKARSHHGRRPAEHPRRHRATRINHKSLTIAPVLCPAG
jgi:hypothetical protein